MLTRKSKTVGVLGGMGPYATEFFFRRVLDLTPAKKDWEHVRMVIDSNVNIPSRTRHYLYNEDSPVPEMIDSCLRLQKYPVDFIVIPCNSASFFLPEIKKKIGIKIANILEVTVISLYREFPNVRSVAVFGGLITYSGKTYRAYLNKKGIKYVHHTQKIQNRIEKIIEEIKLNPADYKIAQHLTDLLKNFLATYPVDLIIFGCTELSYFFDIKCKVPIVDSTTELAKYTIASALNDKNG